MNLTDKIDLIIKNNNIVYYDNPMVIVFRNTDVLTGEYINDTGENAMDGIVLYSSLNTTIMQGRTKPNKSYLDKFFKDGILSNDEKFNYVAPCYLSDAFKKGYHRNCKALAQNRKFPIIRSYNEILGDKDDYVVFEWPCDNFHGWLKSLGCWTVDGNMRTLSGDWGVAYNWIYNIHKNVNNFDALCLERDDWENPSKKKLRFGSIGQSVRTLQRELGIKTDGDFGYITLNAVLASGNRSGIIEVG